MKVRVLLFASLAERAGWRERELDVDEGSTVGGVLETLRRGPLLALPASTRVLCAVNRQHCATDQAVREGDEVGFFPPVSGGSGGASRARITSEALDPGQLTALVRGPDCGAVLCFEGTVRNENEGLEVLGIDYDAYPDMALPVLERIITEVEARWTGTRVAIAHRTGRLELGEASVLVACAAPHRREAFAACRRAMDRVKELLPVWKHEETGSGELRWL